MKPFSYQDIAGHYEQCLEKYGDSHRGVDWPKMEDANKRYEIMLQVAEAGTKATLLDFGCGAGHLYEFMQKQPAEKYGHLQYSGADLSEKFITLCKSKHPEVDFWCGDILQNEALLPEFDYIAMNGVFTEKLGLEFSEMEAYFQKMLRCLFAKARKGIAFNVMSKAVDWEREDLFHLSTDRLISFLVKDLSRNFIIRNDYGLYEYTTYVYRTAR